MPSTTRTQDRLLASIRKAKSAAEPAADAPTAVAPPSQAAESAPKSVAKPAAKPAPTPAAKPASAQRAAAPRKPRAPVTRRERPKPEPQAAVATTDPFQRVQRVWPD
jgi:translation initiation factor IF-2